MTKNHNADWTCGCGARNPSSAAFCEACMAPAVLSTPAAAAAAPPAKRCDCGALLRDSDAHCSVAGGFPLSANPHRVLASCPACRGPLEWSGACYRCHGTTTGAREYWTLPGVEYELMHGHWMATQPAGRRACTPEDNARGIAQVQAILRATPLAIDRRTPA